MSKNIVYLMGAGASFNSIPIVNSIAIRMLFFVNYLHDRLNLGDDKIRYYRQMIDRIKIVGTPDTLARILFLSKKENDLENLRNLISSFFIFEQLVKDDQIKIYSFNDQTGSKELNLDHIMRDLDSRYVSFFSTIIEKDYTGLKLPQNLTILSWNYDLQMEKAYQEISRMDFNSAQGTLNVYPCLHINETSEMENNFSIIKLNGTAGFFERENTRPVFDFLRDSTNQESLEILKDQLIGSRIKFRSFLLFAWEFKVEGEPKNLQENKIVKARRFANEKLKKADVLVIVGYSFPDFNRSIDKKIFEESNIGVIYIQDPNSKEIIQKLEGVKPGLSSKTKEITQIQNFIIPYEFWE